MSLLLLLLRHRSIASMPELFFGCCVMPPSFSPFPHGETGQNFKKGNMMKKRKRPMKKNKKPLSHEKDDEDIPKQSKGRGAKRSGTARSDHLAWLQKASVAKVEQRVPYEVQASSETDFQCD